MKYQTALAYFKTGLEIARILKIKSQAVYEWKVKGVVPKKRAERLQAASNGECKVDPNVYRRAKPKGKSRDRAALPR